MSTARFFFTLATCAPLLHITTTLAQQPAANGPQDFPVMMRQTVTAGKTPPGTPVQATLIIPTLFSGKVIPEGAIFCGVVVESTAKSATSPSRLNIRMESLQWKTGSLAVSVYMTQWYHPMRLSLGEDRFDDRPNQNGDHTKRTWAAYNPNASDALLFPNDSDQSTLKTAPPPAMTLSSQRLMMRNVQLENESNGGHALVCSHSNLKLDKSTTYILTTGEPRPN